MCDKINKCTKSLQMNTKDTRPIYGLTAGNLHIKFVLQFGELIYW